MGDVDVGSEDPADCLDAGIDLFLGIFDVNFDSENRRS